VVAIELGMGLTRSVLVTSTVAAWKSTRDHMTASASSGNLAASMKLDQLGQSPRRAFSTACSRATRSSSDACFAVEPSPLKGVPRGG
jgi:hypothetical protein